MTASVLQEKQFDNVATLGSIGLAFTSPVTLGSAIHVIVTFDVSGGTTLASCADTLNGSFGTVLDVSTDVADTQALGHYALTNSAAGADTVTVSFVGTTPYCGILIREIGGVSATALDGHNVANQTAPGLVTDAVTVSATNANQPALISAVSMNAHGSGAPTAGTGFTTGILVFPAFGSLGRSESKRVTLATSQAATFTAVANDTHVTVMAIFDEGSVSVAASIGYVNHMSPGIAGF